MSPHLREQAGLGTSNSPRVPTQRKRLIVSKSTLPRVAREQRDLSDQAAIPFATRRASESRPMAYPGVAMNVLAWLHSQDAEDEQPPAAPVIEEPPAPPAAERDEHAFDTDRLIPVGRLVTVPLLAPAAAAPLAPAPPAIEEMPNIPAGSPRLLFGALDALDRLPKLYFADAESYEMATSIAAIQTYVALQPELLAPTGLSADLLALELHELAILLDGEV